MPDILDPTQSIYDILAQKRALLEQQRPDVAAQLPMIGQATPGERMYQAQQQQAPQDLASTLHQVKDMATQAATPQGAKPKDAQAVSSSIDDVLGYLDPLKPKQSYGPNIGKSLGMGDNAGGILGLGVQPIDVLAFALGAAVTSKMPQDKALATTMMFAGLPKQFRDSQEQNARKFIDDKMAQINSQLAEANLGQRQLENATRATEIQRRNSILSSVTNRLAEGRPLSQVERQIIAANAHGVFDPAFVKEFIAAPDLESQFAAYQKMAEQAKSAGLGNVTASFDGPGGMKLNVGGASNSQDVSQRTREIMAASREAGKPMSIAEAHQQALQEEVQLAGNKAGAVAENTPLPTPVQSTLVKYEELGKQLQSLKENYDPAFVGPVAYRSYNARRQGLIPGVELPSEKEIKFHQAQEYLSDIRLRVQSGAQTSEPEAARLLGTLPQGTDKPEVYGPGLQKAIGDTQRTLGNTKKYATTPKKALQTEAPAPTASAPAPAARKELPPPPAGWKY